MICDIIGDVHGQATLLESLLESLGYEMSPGGVWGHGERIALFLGDLINKGPEIKKTVSLVRKMSETGSAACILGNHEWAWITGNEGAIQDTLADYGTDTECLAYDLEWVLTLPLWIELDAIRIVHAFWDPVAIGLLDQFRKVNPDWRSIEKGSSEERAALRLLKGPYYHPAQDEGILQNGYEMKTMRLRWWNLDFPLYHPTDKLLFFGHYCIPEGPYVISGNICCLDSCVHRTGRLSAYSWEGETVLSNSRLMTVQG